MAKLGSYLTLSIFVQPRSRQQFFLQEDASALYHAQLRQEILSLGEIVGIVCLVAIQFRLALGQSGRQGLNPQ